MNRDRFQEDWELIAAKLFQMSRRDNEFFRAAPGDTSPASPTQVAFRLNSAFLCVLTGRTSPEQRRALGYLREMAENTEKVDI